MKINVWHSIEQCTAQFMHGLTSSIRDSNHTFVPNAGILYI